MERVGQYRAAQARYDAQMPRERRSVIDSCWLCHEPLPVEELTRCGQCGLFTCWCCQDSDERGWCVQCAAEHRRLLALEGVAA